MIKKKIKYLHLSDNIYPLVTGGTELFIQQLINEQIKSKDVKRQTQKVKEETKISESLKEETKISESLEEEKTLKNKNIDTNKNMIQLVNLINEKLENINKINEIMYNKKLKTKV